MKDLIRKILRESLKSEMTIQEVVLHENFINQLLIEGKSTVNVPNRLNSELTLKVNSFYNWNSNGNKWICPDEYMQPNKNGQVSCEIMFDINLTNHWKQRLLRNSEPDYAPLNPLTGLPGKFHNSRILNPDTYEGIDLFINNLSTIVKFIKNAKDWRLGQGRNLLLTKNNYQEIVEVYRFDKNKYKVNFITQIKGVSFFDTPQLKGSYKVKDLI
jgi:hypothetical protein